MLSDRHINIRSGGNKLPSSHKKKNKKKRRNRMKIPNVNRLGPIDDFRAIKRMLIEDSTVFNLFAPPMDYMDLLAASVATFDIEDNGDKNIKKKNNDVVMDASKLFGGDSDSESTVD